MAFGRVASPIDALIRANDGSGGSGERCRVYRDSRARDRGRVSRCTRKRAKAYRPGAETLRGSNGRAIRRLQVSVANLRGTTSPKRARSIARTLRARPSSRGLGTRTRGVARSLARAALYRNKTGDLRFFVPRRQNVATRTCFFRRLTSHPVYLDALYPRDRRCPLERRDTRSEYARATASCAGTWANVQGCRMQSRSKRP